MFCMTYSFLAFYVLSYLSFITVHIVAISQVKSTLAFKSCRTEVEQELEPDVGSCFLLLVPCC